MRHFIIKFIKLLRSLADFFVALLVFAAFALVRAIPAKRAVDFGGAAARFLGHLVPRSNLALKQIAAAFPHKTAAEHRTILSECWDNLGRTAVEYCHLDHIWDRDEASPSNGNIEIIGSEYFFKLRDDKGPAIIVTAHLANWELPMVAAAVHGLKIAALYRAPNNKWIARWVLNRRKLAMGELIASKRGSVHALDAVLTRGDKLGLLVDQHFWFGVKSKLFGREVSCNPVFARLARLHHCAVHAVRVIRLPGEKFRIELTPALDLPRDLDGKIDVQGAVDRVNHLLEKWISEYPGQWLWLHRRWRES
jgi:KDO2-lipid IV(A) lauroyltransferase